MISPLEIVPMILSQHFSSFELVRTPESSAVMDNTLNVAEFDKVLDSKLAIAYAAALDVIHRVRTLNTSKKAIDIACGPGQFSIYLAKYLQYQNVLGVDLSPPMIEVAKTNATKENMSQQVRFEKGDATCLQEIDDDSFDLATFNDAAHHMPELEGVSAVLAEMERVTSPEGTLFAMDLVRLKNSAITERYVNAIGKDYLKSGLSAFFEDFRNSMYAAWTPEELRSAVPASTARKWYQIIPWGLPTIQMLVGLPVGQEAMFITNQSLWSKEDLPIRKHLRREWQLFKAVLFRGRIIQV